MYNQIIESVARFASEQEEVTPWELLPEEVREGYRDRAWTCVRWFFSAFPECQEAYQRAREVSPGRASAALIGGVLGGLGAATEALDFISETEEARRESS